MRAVGRPARNYMFTLFEDVAVFPDGPPPFDEGLFPPWLAFMVYQRELCPETSRVHFQVSVLFSPRIWSVALDSSQGYLECVGEKSFKQLHEVYGLERCSFQQRRGTQEQAIAYASKEDTRVEGPWVYGVKKDQGKRNDMLADKKRMDEGMSFKRLAEESFANFVRYGKAYKEYKRTVTKPRDFKPFCILIVGPSGTGKSRFGTLLAQYLGSVFKLPKKSSGPWFDDYDNQDVLLCDEFDGDVMRPTVFNEICDRYECVVPAHGSAGHQLVSRFHIVISNYHPKFWWRKRSVDQVKQTMRRFDWVIKMIPHRPSPNPAGVSRFLNLFG